VIGFFLQFLPVSAFVSYALGNGEPTPKRWLGAFALGSSLALARWLFMRWKKMPLNPLVFGADLYLVYGLVACLSGQPMLTDLLAYLQAAGLLAAMLVAGIIATLASPRGFVFADGEPRAEVVKASLILLVIAAVATVVSYQFRGDTTYSGVLPVMSLAVSQRLLRRRLRPRA
jgi:hypothetical protein